MGTFLPLHVPSRGTRRNETAEKSENHRFRVVEGGFTGRLFSRNRPSSHAGDANALLGRMEHLHLVGNSAGASTDAVVQSRMVPSPEPEHRMVPSGLKASEWT